ncbi:MAG: hypothetical protein CSA35_01390 [Dethiosulfovibrio peptidovorans]|nr:MAG: hypothetical protein CSA35_01390 [Dethiosulfovibrio peptidovorans]
MQQPLFERGILPWQFRNAQLIRLNRFWRTNITCYGVSSGFIYCVAVINRCGRSILSWEVSNILDAQFCVITLNKILDVGQSKILNADQGCQFTGKSFFEFLKNVVSESA